jgi:hypothetical protein
MYIVYFCISQIVPKNFIKISLIIKECPQEILIKLAIVLKISKSSWNIAVLILFEFLFHTIMLTDNIYYHPSLPLYLPADSISKTCIKVHVSWAGLINSEQELSPNSPNI